MTAARPRPDSSPWLTKDEAAAYARMSVRTINRAMHDGELRYSGGGYRGAVPVLIHVDDLDEFIRNRGSQQNDEGAANAAAP